jgi:predicted oxidoreductase
VDSVRERAVDGRASQGDSPRVLRKVALGGLAAVVLLGPILWGVSQSMRASKRASAQPSNRTSADVVVVGAGIAGLSAAYELALAGRDVIVVDVSSVFGGHAVMATGELAIVDTPDQRAQGIADSPDLAYKDFQTWGEDPDPLWTRRYVDRSRVEIYDWLATMGITYEAVIPKPGNTVPRAHRTKGRGIGLVTPIFAEVARRPNVWFRWNSRVDRLLVENGRVVGVLATNTRTGAAVELRGHAVVMATGGYQSNLERVRATWTKDLPMPATLLAGSGWNSQGTGHDAAKAAGAALTRLDHQWNYISGMPDPRYPGENRGLNAYNEESMWVNTDAQRFMQERWSPKLGLPELVKQPGATYWSVFDEKTKKTFWVAGSDWAAWSRVERLIFGDPALMKTANTVEELAAKAGLPPNALKATIDHWNEMVDAGVDLDYKRWGPGSTFKPKKIDKPPYYAAQFYTLTRKSLGGVAIDGDARAVDAAGKPVPGLWAVGELTGFAGVNGKYGLEGTYLAPSIFTGRVAGRALAAELGAKPAPAPRPLPQFLTTPPAKGEMTSGPALSSSTLAATCLGCHQLQSLVTAKRPGYWHFEKVHTVVLAKQVDCGKCHAELGTMYDPERHHIDRLTQPRVCTTCHAGEDR